MQGRAQDTYFHMYDAYIHDSWQICTYFYTLHKCIFHHIAIIHIDRYDVCDVCMCTIPHSLVLHPQLPAYVRNIYTMYIICCLNIFNEPCLHFGRKFIIILYYVKATVFLWEVPRGLWRQMYGRYEQSRSPTPKNVKSGPCIAEVNLWMEWIFQRRRNLQSHKRAQGRGKGSYNVKKEQEFSRTPNT